VQRISNSTGDLGGDLALLQAASVDLSGCSGAMLSVDRIVPRSKEAFRPLLNGNLCSYVRSAHGNYPLKHIFRDLELGTEYFVQAQYRSENGYSIKKFASPASFIPRHNGPSSPPPPFLVESTSTSITGPLSQIVESGRQYRFQVDMTWTVGDYSFHVVALNEKGRSGNSPSLTVIAKGVFHTHLGRKFILSHGEEATMPLPFDIANDVLKSTLEDLISIDSVNVSKIVYGQTGD
jgi:hypothetical protein